MAINSAKRAGFHGDIDGATGKLCPCVCVRASARAWAKECLRFNMKEGRGCNDWLKRWVAIVRQ